MKVFCIALATLVLTLPANAQDENRAVFDGVEVFAPVVRERSHSKKFLLNQADAEFVIPENVRVMIFPHHGPYSSPQGREKNVGQVTFEAEGTCSLHPASDASFSQPIRTGKTFVFDVASHTETQWLRCDRPVKLLREQGLESIRYQGLFEIKAGATPQGVPAIRVIQHISFEEYLKGVVPSEMPALWPMEALKAQAISARTYGLHQMVADVLEIQARDYDMDDTIFFQAYLGLSRRMKSTDTAVEETRGQVMTYGGRPIEAFFSADSGGYTELAENVWGEVHPYCPSVPEAYDLKWIDSDWTHSAPLSEVQERLKKAQLIPADAVLKDLSIPSASVNKSGRAMQVFVKLSDNSTKPIAGTTFQRAMRLRSNLIKLQVASPSRNAPLHVTITGKGFGHGVGMNQWGARVLANRMNWTHQQILNFYFHSVEIR